MRASKIDNRLKLVFKSLQSQVLDMEQSIRFVPGTGK